MPELGDAAVEFNDWLYIAEQMLGCLTDSASTWFSESLRCARETYDLYQKSSAMDRLTISPVPMRSHIAAWSDAPWSEGGHDHSQDRVRYRGLVPAARSLPTWGHS